MILAKIWKYKRTQTIINKWTCCHLPGCRTPSHFGLCHWGGQCSPAEPKKQTVTATPKQRTWTPPHEQTARVRRKPCHSAGVAFGHGEKGKRRRESKPKCGIWRVCVCVKGRARSLLLSRAQEQSWAAWCQPAEAGHRRDQLLTYSWQLSQIADVFESSYFKGFTAVFLRQDLNEREAVPWTRSGKVIGRRNPESWHIHIKIDATFYICWWLDN